MKVRISSKQTYPVCPTVFLLNGKPYKKLRIPYNPLYEITRTLQLSEQLPFGSTLLPVLSHEKKYVDVAQAEQIVKAAKLFFGVSLQLVVSDLATNLIGVLLNTQAVLDMQKLLDSLLIETLTRTVLCMYQVAGQHTDIISAALQNYIQASHRSATEKMVLRGLVRLEESQDEDQFTDQSSEELIDDDIDIPAVVVEKPSAKQKIKPGTSALFAKQQPAAGKLLQPQSAQLTKARPADNQDNMDAAAAVLSATKNERPRYQYDRSKEKRPYESTWGAGRRNEKKMFELGISGADADFWRERTRPQKAIPKTKETEEEPESAHSDPRAGGLKYNKVQKSPAQKQADEKSEPAPKSKAIQTLPQAPASTHPSHSVIFEYPRQGKSFDFSTLSLPVGLTIFPLDLQIELYSGQIRIMKGDKGIKRKTTYSYTENGLLAENLTIILGGYSNIEDGGIKINGGRFEDMVKQNWFYIDTMIVHKINT